MMMAEGLDTGDMLEKAVVPIDPEETGGSLHDKLSVLGADLILSTLQKMEEGTITPIPQTEENTCYAKMLKKSMGDIDWTMDAFSIERLIRGLNPWPSAYTWLQGKLLKLWAGDVQASEEDKDNQAECGVILSASEDGLKIQTGKGILNITSLQIEGKKRMDTGAFLRGFPVEKGQRLGRS